MEFFSPIFFYIFSFFIVLGACCTIFTQKAFVSMLWAVNVFLFVGGVYFLLNATFNAVVQIMIFAVLLPILLLFYSIFDNSEKARSGKMLGKDIILPVICGLFFFIAMSLGLANNYFERIFDGDSGDLVLNMNLSTLRVVGETMIADYSFLLLLFPVLMLICVVGVGMVSVFKSREG